MLEMSKWRESNSKEKMIGAFKQIEAGSSVSERYRQSRSLEEEGRKGLARKYGKIYSKIPIKDSIT